MNSRVTAKDVTAIKILDLTDDTTDFTCGIREIDDFIQKEAWGFQKERLGVTYLFLKQTKIVGFSTLSMADLKREKMSAEDRPPIGIENYPALLIGQLAVCSELQNKDIGTYICDYCLDKALKLSEKVGCRFIVVNSIDCAVGFYKQYGFILLPKQEGREQKVMFLNILDKSVEA